MLLLAAAVAPTLAPAQISGWGDNTERQLLGEVANFLNPISLPLVSTARQVAAGDSHAVGLMPDGSVVAWGNGFTSSVYAPPADAIRTPVAIPGLPNNVAAVFAGSATCYALTNNGTLYSWGNIGVGELGTGFSYPENIGPTYFYKTANPVINGTNIVKVFSNALTLAVIKSDGTVWVCGRNAYWNLGLGDLTNRSTLTQNPDLTGAKSIAISTGHGLAAMADGTVKAWGGNPYRNSWNSYFSGATGTLEDLPTPQVLSGLNDIVQVAAGNTCSFARTSDGRVFSFGEGYRGLLGRDSSQQELTPTLIPDLPPIVDIQARGDSAYALAADGSVYAWGVGSGLGTTTRLDGFPLDRSPVPLKVPGVVANRISGGRAFCLAQAVSARLSNFSLLETTTHGYRNVKARVTLDLPAGPGGVRVRLVSKEAGNSLPNGLPTTVGTALQVTTVPSPISNLSIWRVRNTTTNRRYFQFWVFLTGVG
ncbi:MAG: hypothetical protein C4320_03855, partial [Armatimonadota bacterium]